MEIPTPPSDSLYKFKAISGLLFVLGAFFIAYKVLEGAFTFRIQIEKLDADTYQILSTAFDWGRWLWVAVILIAGGETWLAFREWRIKIQKPQDELLQIQLEQARLALARSKREAGKEGADATESSHATG